MQNSFQKRMEENISSSSSIGKDLHTPFSMLIELFVEGNRRGEQNYITSSQFTKLESVLN